jgi:CheY-like chemotaxis protein
VSPPRPARGDPREWTVLLVDDDHGILESMQDILEDEGYRVRTARNGAEALALLPTLDRPCVVVLDLTMPVMTGEEFLAQAHEAGLLRGIPVLVMTASRLRPHPPGASALLRKPMSLNELLGAIRNHCDPASVTRP